jgi:hypothetical protein
MNKKKLNTEDGSEFTVYYLSDDKEYKNEVSPIGQLGTWIGDTLIEPLTEAQGKVAELIIDDTIPSDYIAHEDLIAGRLYKSHSLGVVVRFVEIDFLMASNEALARVSRHGGEFLVEVGDLKKASQIEVEKYLKKKID